MPTWLGLGWKIPRLPQEADNQGAIKDLLQDIGAANLLTIGIFYNTYISGMDGKCLGIMKVL